MEHPTPPSSMSAEITTCILQYVAHNNSNRNRLFCKWMPFQVHEGTPFILMLSVLFSFSETSGHLGSGQWHQWNETRASGHAVRKEGTCTYTCTDEV